jgi:hypothetical protein
MAEYRKEVDDLLKLYAKYKELLFIEADLSTKRAKQKIIGVVDAELVNDHETAKKNLQRLSDSMTFSNPFVWILYKFEAYKNEAQSIRTIRDFRIHCSKVGDICTKRFLFVNEQLTQKDHPTLMDDLYDGSLLLNALLKDKSLQALVNDPTFMALWKTHEYNTVDTRVTKWESYSITA